MKRKTFLQYIVFFCFFITVLLCSNYSIASTKLEGIENFPQSYRPYLYELKKKHPNWVFTALYTGIDWNYVVSKEYRNNKSLVPLSYSDVWKCTDSGIYNVEIDNGWVNASKSAVEYTMDPRNFLNEVRIFQFEKLTYDANTNTKDGVEKILYGTEFYNRNVTYKNSAGAVIDMHTKYSDLIWNSAIYSGVSPYHLASRIRQEVGPFITHNSISGTVSGYEGYYNFYNIGATSSTEPLGAIKNGLQFAKDGKGATEKVKNNLLIPWTDPEKAIKGGAVFIGSSYILVGQNNLYLQKFDVNNDRGNDIFWHQYMTNCLAPYSESGSIYKAYNSNGMLNSSIGFIIPVYENMPEMWTESPNILASDYVADNTKMFANVNGSLNVRTGPSTSYEVLTSITKEDTVTRIKRGVQNGERWDKIQLENGMIGYVFQSYLKEIPKVNISSIKLNTDNNIINKGTSGNVSITIEPPDADNKTIIWSSSNDDIVTVENGIITGISSGNATITAKDSITGVFDSIDITVKTRVTGVYMYKEDMQLFVGDTVKLTAHVLPEDADDKTLTWESNNNEIVSVNNEGLVTALKDGTAQIIVKSNEAGVEAKCNIEVKKIEENAHLTFKEPLKVEGDEISNLDINKLKVSEIKELIETNLNIEIYDNSGALLEEGDMIGTGSKLVLKDESENELFNYTFIVYGDVNGDGLINSLDVLIIQRHILETKPITGIFLKSGNISKNGAFPSSLDVLKLQKHILEIKLIEQ